MLDSPMIRAPHPAMGCLALSMTGLCIEWTIDDAGSYIRQAYELNPDSEAIVDSLGWFYFKKGKFQEARQELLKAVGMLTEELDENDAVMFDHLARAHFHLGEFREAFEKMERAVELDPESEEFRKRLEEYRNKVPAQPDQPPERDADEGKSAPEKEAA